MTDDEITRLAQRSLRCYIEAFQSRDVRLLSEGNFSSLMRRGIERYIKQLPADAGSWVDDLDWASYRLTERKLFSNLRAYIHEVPTPERQRVQLTAFDREGCVCEFASIGEPTAETTLDMHRELMERLSDQPWSDQMRLQLTRSIPFKRWSNLIGFSTWFKVDALLQAQAGLSSGSKPGEAPTFTVNLPVGYFASLSEVSAQRLMDDLVPVLTNNARLTHDNPSALHIILVEIQEPPGVITSWLGGPPQDRWLADRLVAISDGQIN
jgi:hypothetical protein